MTDTHSKHTLSKFCFFANALFTNKLFLPSHNFLSRFLPHAFSTFASRAFLFVEKITHKKLTPFGKLAKELKPSLIAKTLAKKFTPPRRFVISSVINESEGISHSFSNFKTDSFNITYFNTFV